MVLGKIGRNPGAKVGEGIEVCARSRGIGGEGGTVEVYVGACSVIVSAQVVI